MKRTYECMVLLDNREVKKGWEELKAMVAGVFDKHGAEVVSARRWDERRLTFPIKRHKRATYLLMYFNADTPQIHAIRRDMEFNEAILRNFVTSCESIPEEAFEPEAAFDVASIRVEDEPEEPRVGKQEPAPGQEDAAEKAPEEPAAASAETGPADAETAKVSETAKESGTGEPVPAAGGSSEKPEEESR